MDTWLNIIEGPVAAWIGLLTAIPVFSLWFDLVWGKHRRHKKWMKNALEARGRLPAVLIVDLLAGKDISAAVSHFMASQDDLKDIPQNRIVKVERNCDITPEDMPMLAKDIQDKAGEILLHGADELYVFLACPVTAAAMVGAELANISCKVQMYQNDRASSTYVNFGPLRHPRF